MPHWHELDGGRYIGTDDLVITRDPEEDWVNVGTYRIMVHGPDRLGLHMSPGKHGRVHKDKYHAQGKPLPIAVLSVIIRSTSSLHPPMCRIALTNTITPAEFSAVRWKW